MERDDGVRTGVDPMTIRTAIHPRAKGHVRRAFTFIELVIVAAINAVLASASVYAMYGMMEDAKVARTKSQFSRIDRLVSEQWEAYRTRAVPIRVNPGTPPNSEPFVDMNANGVYDASDGGPGT